MDDYVGFALANRRDHRFPIEAVRHDRSRTCGPQRLRLFGPMRHRSDVVAALHQQRNESLAERPRGAGDEDLHC
jgi:hypothetical protein